MSAALAYLAAQAVARLIDQRVPLTVPTTVVSEPPSMDGDHPAVAVMLDRFRRIYSNAEDVMLDDVGKPIIGNSYSMDGVAAGTLAEMADGVRPIVVGTLRCRGTIWIGCRLPPLREDVESKVETIFTSERMTIGTVVTEISGIRVAGYTMPCSWPVAVSLRDSEWSGEAVFGEAVQSTMEIQVDVSILSIDTAPIVTSLVLRMLDNVGSGFEDFTITADGLEA